MSERMSEERFSRLAMLSGTDSAIDELLAEAERARAAEEEQQKTIDALIEDHEGLAGRLELRAVLRAAGREAELLELVRERSSGKQFCCSFCFQFVNQDGTQDHGILCPAPRLLQRQRDELTAAGEKLAEKLIYWDKQEAHLRGAAYCVDCEALAEWRKVTK